MVNVSGFVIEIWQGHIYVGWRKQLKKCRLIVLHGKVRNTLLESSDKEAIAKKVLIQIADLERSGNIKVFKKHGGILVRENNFSQSLSFKDNPSKGIELR